MYIFLVCFFSRRNLRVCLVCFVHRKPETQGSLLGKNGGFTPSTSLCLRRFHNHLGTYNKYNCVCILFIILLNLEKKNTVVIRIFSINKLNIFSYYLNYKLCLFNFFLHRFTFQQNFHLIATFQKNLKLFSLLCLFSPLHKHFSGDNFCTSSKMRVSK